MGKMLHSVVDRLQTVGCKLCGGGDSRKLFQRERLWLLECCQCGLVCTYPQPAPEERKFVYDDDYIRSLPGSGGLETDAGLTLDRVSWEAARVHYATAGTRGGRVLDIGCAQGRFLAQLQQQGWEVWGVEFNLQAAAAASKRLKATVFGGDFMDANLPKEYFDVVTLFHVIEHVLDPPRTVDKIRSVLKKNGRVVLETPDFASKNARRLGPNWLHVKPREHLYYFDECSLRNLLEASGFRVQKVRRCGGLGVLAPGGTVNNTDGLKGAAFHLRHWLAPTPWLRNLARRFYWDFLRQNEHILIVASRRS